MEQHLSRITSKGGAVSTFEDEFSEAQSDLISITLEYSSKRADDIYVLFSWLGGVGHVDAFFAQANRTFRRNELPGIHQKNGRMFYSSTGMMDSMLSMMRVRSMVVRYRWRAICITV